MLLFSVKTIYLGDRFCLNPVGGSIRDEGHLGLSSDCRSTRAQLIFPSVGNEIQSMRSLFVETGGENDRENFLCSYLRF